LPNQKIPADKAKLLSQFQLPVRVLQQWMENGLLLSEAQF